MSRSRARCSAVTPSFRPTLETLENRLVMTAGLPGSIATPNLFAETSLVSNLSNQQLIAQGFSPATNPIDPQLRNPWGITESAGGPFWVSDNNGGVSTLYNTSGAKQGLVVSIPTPIDPTGNTGSPTGDVFNGNPANFIVSANGKSGSAVFLFATEDGTIVAWSPKVDPTHAVIAVDHSGNNFSAAALADPSKAAGAVYKSLAMATDSKGQTFLYAANFRTGNIDQFDSSFHLVRSFSDPRLQAKGYAAFNVAVFNDKLYVTFAKQDANKHDPVAGAGKGFLDTFNLDGTGRDRLVSSGPLDAPWGLTIAPSAFGPFAAGTLLVGNFGNGEINAFNPASGKFLGSLQNEDGSPVKIDGLWALQFGNGKAGGDANTLYFTAGLNREQDGLFGSLSPVKPTAGAEADAVLLNSLLEADPGAQRFLVVLHDRLEIREANGTLTQGQADLEQALDIVLASASRHHNRERNDALDDLFRDL